MTIRTWTLGLVLASVAFASSAFAQEAPASPAPPSPSPAVSAARTVDDSIAENNCAPRNKHRDASGSYDGCLHVADSALPDGTPTYLMSGSNGPDGEPMMVRASDVASRDPALLTQLVVANRNACTALRRGESLHRIWSIIRPIITVASIAYGGAEFGTAYGVLMGMNGIQSEGDHFVYERDMHVWRDLTLNYCRLNNLYESAAGPQLMDAAAAQQH